VRVIDVAGGTSEQAWDACGRLRALPAFAWEQAAKVVVIAPHPDDETLGVGGMLCTLARSGCAIEVVALTEGEASHPHSDAITKTELACLRARERRLALSRLGLEHATLLRLGLADGSLSHTRGLAERLLPLIQGASFCLAPFRQDGHPDHDAAGSAAARACDACGVRLHEYPVWAWHWARPNSDDLPWWRGRRVALEADALQAKAHAVHAYRSQIAPLSRAPSDGAVLPGRVLEHFGRGFEVLFV
jgi:LmbE family N-acetylglucosaminyl deacetylase